jgi:hypothetical protein
MALMFREEEVNQERYKGAPFKEVMIIPTSSQANEVPKGANLARDWFNHEAEINKMKMMPKIKISLRNDSI